MKLGVVGIIIEGDRKIAGAVNAVLSEYADLIIGRMGLPDNENGIFLISVGVKGSQERISAMTGKIGRFNGVKIRSAVTDVEINEKRQNL